MSARWTDGDDDARIDVVLRRRVVRAAFQPVVRLESGLTAAYRGSVRGPLGSPLEHEERLLTAAAYRGVVPQLDDLRFHTITRRGRNARSSGLPCTLFVHRTRRPCSRHDEARLGDGALPLVVSSSTLAAPVDRLADLVEAAAGHARPGTRSGSRTSRRRTFTALVVAARTGVRDARSENIRARRSDLDAVVESPATGAT